MIQVSFSGGRSSAMMAYIMLENPHVYPRNEMIFMFANTGKEMPQTLDFVHECDKRWNLNMVWIEYDRTAKFRQVTYETASRQGEPFEALIDAKKFLPHGLARFCTSDLKVKPMKAYLKNIGFDYYDSALGIRRDEPRRYHKLKGASGKDDFEYIFPLWDAKITRDAVTSFWKSQPFDLTIHSGLGNCDFCFLKGRNKKINQARLMPDRLDWWIAQEDKIGGRFSKDYTMRQLKEQAVQPGLFDDTIDCFCGD